MSVDVVDGLTIADGLCPGVAIEMTIHGCRSALRASTSPERTALSLLGERPRRFSEILAQVELPGLHLHRDLAAPHLELPPSRADGRANAERRIFENFTSQFPGNRNVFASRRHAIDDPGRQGFFGAEESSG